MLPVTGKLPVIIRGACGERHQATPALNGPIPTAQRRQTTPGAIPQTPVRFLAAQRELPRAQTLTAAQLRRRLLPHAIHHKRLHLHPRVFAFRRTPERLPQDRRRLQRRPRFSARHRARADRAVRGFDERRRRGRHPRPEALPRLLQILGPGAPRTRLVVVNNRWFIRAAR